MMIIEAGIYFNIHDTNVFRVSVEAYRNNVYVFYLERLNSTIIAAQRNLIDAVDFKRMIDFGSFEKMENTIYDEVEMKLIDQSRPAHITKYWTDVTTKTKKQRKGKALNVTVTRKSKPKK